jgi:hypothetical protein
MEGYYLCLWWMQKGRGFLMYDYYVADGSIKRRTDYRAIRPKTSISIETPCIFFGTGVKKCRSSYL